MCSDDTEAERAEESKEKEEGGRVTGAARKNKRQRTEQDIKVSRNVGRTDNASAVVEREKTF